MNDTYYFYEVTIEWDNGDREVSAFEWFGEVEKYIRRIGRTEGVLADSITIKRIQAEEEQDEEIAPEPTPYDMYGNDMRKTDSFGTPVTKEN